MDVTDLRRNGGVVGIGRILPGADVGRSRRFEKHEVEYWGVGVMRLHQTRGLIDMSNSAGRRPRNDGADYWGYPFCRYHSIRLSPDPIETRCRAVLERLRAVRDMGVLRGISGCGSPAPCRHVHLRVGATVETVSPGRSFDEDDS